MARRKPRGPVFEELRRKADRFREQVHIDSMQRFRPGQKVKFQAKDGRIVIGVIIRSGRKRWTIHEDTPKGPVKWYVPARMLTIVDEGSIDDALEAKRKHDRAKAELDSKLRGDFYPGQRVVWFSNKGTGRRSDGPRKGHRGTISHFASKRWVVIEDGPDGPPKEKWGRKLRGTKWYIPASKLEPDPVKGGGS